MSEQESNVPLQNDGPQKSYSTMEKKSTGEILNVGSNDGSNIGNSDGSNDVNDFDQTSPLKGEEIKANQVYSIYLFFYLFI